MITKLKRMLLTVAAVAAMLVPAMVPVAVHADVVGGLKCGVEFKLDETGACQLADNGTDGLQGLITKVINIFSIIVGLIAVVMIIVGGLKYITSGGDSGNVSGAKNTIIYAIVGLIIVALAQFIVRFVLSNSSDAVNTGA